MGRYMHPLDPANREIQVIRLKALAADISWHRRRLSEFRGDLARTSPTGKHRDFFEKQRPAFQELRTLYLPWSGALANFYEVNADRVIDSNIGYFDLFTWLLKERDEVGTAD